MANSSRLCQAMKDKGIESPSSQEGIDFCLNCPYPNGCVVFENGVRASTAKMSLNMKRARIMQEAGLTVEVIAKRLGKSKRTVERYLE